MTFTLCLVPIWCWAEYSLSLTKNRNFSLCTLFLLQHFDYVYAFFENFKPHSGISLVPLNCLFFCFLTQLSPRILHPVEQGTITLHCLLRNNYVKVLVNILCQLALWQIIIHVHVKIPTFLPPKRIVIAI